MTTGALTISWGAPVRGREMQGLEVFAGAIQNAETWSKDGRLHGHKEFINQQGLGGFQLLEGELSELLTITQDDVFRTTLVKAGQIVEDIKVNVYGGGSDAAVQELIGTYVGALGELGIS